MNRIIILTLLLQLFAGSAFGATISWEDTSVLDSAKKRLYTFRLQGEIKPGDTFNFDQLPKPARTITVLLDSNGGDLRTAIELGRELRQAEARVFVAVPSSCISACVFTFVGGVERSVFGRLGIHRPYSTRTGEVSTQQATKT